MNLKKEKSDQLLIGDWEEGRILLERELQSLGGSH